MSLIKLSILQKTYIKYTQFLGFYDFINILLTDAHVAALCSILSTTLVT